MAVHQPWYGGPSFPCGADDDAQDTRVRPEYAACFLSSARSTVPSGGGGAHSELTYNNNNNNGDVGAPRKRLRADFSSSSSSSALLPFPGMANRPVVDVMLPARLLVPSTSGLPSAPAPASSFFDDDVLVSEHGAEMDAIVRVESERMRAGLERARKRQCQSLVRAASSSAVGRRLQEKEAELVAARRRAADLEDRLRQVAAESQAWCGVARSNQAVAAGLRSTLDDLLRATPTPAEGFGESDADLSAADDDAQSTSRRPAAGQWACKSCGEGEASVLLLPCRHLCLCKVCEPRFEACPVCLAAKNASIHIAVN